MRLLLVRTLCISILASVIPGAISAVNWKGEALTLRTRGTPLKTLFKDFGANYKVPVVVSELIDDVFIGSIENETPDELLDRLSRLYHLAWYFNGDTLYVYKAHQVSSKILTPDNTKSKMLKQYLASQKVTGVPGCKLREMKNISAFEVSGVPACIQRVTTVINEVDQKEKIRSQNKETIRIFPLRYASAADITYKYRTQEVVVPGVVSVLSKMRTENSLPAVDGGENIGGKTQFSADPSQNAVLIRSRESNMSIYKDLIEQLDKQNHQIEISVAIIDVDEANLKQLGVDWNMSVDSGALSASFNSGISDSSYMSSVVSNSGQFMARVSALQQKSQAHILSQPSVVTLNNVQAILDKNITFYTRVEGKNVANLESVTAGTLMRVTPRVVESLKDNGKIEKVNLVLNIQDGQQVQQSASSDALPQVQNSEITTQAALRPGESLLLGGFVQDKKVKGDRGIPWLGQIPLIGKLFSTERSEEHSVVRLFLIKATPLDVREQIK